MEMPEYPWYVTEQDRYLMETTCQPELEAWRMAKRWRNSLPTIDAKLDFRRMFEQAFDHLQMAYARVLALPRQCA